VGVSRQVIPALAFLFPVAGAQVPPGLGYDSGIHPNPVVTFVSNEDFRPSGYEEARRMMGTELLGLSGLTASRQAIEIAPGGTLQVRVLGRRTEVLTFPVVRQRFLLDGGEAFELYEFRSPRTDLPADEEEALLNQEALGAARDEGEGRFGRVAPPLELSIRGRPALLFSEPDLHTLFWRERGISYVAVSAVAVEDLFNLVEDLL
jgi:hypothetical protein